MSQNGLGGQPSDKDPKSWRNIESSNQPKGSPEQAAGYSNTPHMGGEVIFSWHEGGTVSSHAKLKMEWTVAVYGMV
ncbi:hypothetical protein N7478_011622 [Penicillium angulare]|uniref:uncharacterized protein n=1 Tax=Penicillium angulare TaxID=116970 RepID=UPI002540E534|nr:uncharacterized protein N7478_011622 [Penicillium angulare]KAJ5261027.1 hypothetical protein N7478_011622 [Penicillium angulare]